MKMDAEPEDKDLLILKMRAANFELAIENMQLQKELLEHKSQMVKAELAYVLGELKKKAKEDLK